MIQNRVIPAWISYLIILVREHLSFMRECPTQRVCAWNSLNNMLYRHWINQQGQNFNGLLFFVHLIPGLPYVHLSSPMPSLYRSHKTIPRGVANRRAALAWIKNNNIKEGRCCYGKRINARRVMLKG